MALPRLINDLSPRSLASLTAATEGHPSSIVPAAKSAILGANRPGFTGAANQMNCGSNMSRNHLLSWESIRDGYHAALNPSSNTSCSNNLGLLYDAVGLTQYTPHIQAACATSNINNDTVTTADQTVLSNLNSSINNLRCGHARSNQSVGGALDVPCADQAYNNSNGRIEITGTTADRIASFLAIGTTSPRPFYVYKTNQSCTGGNCSNTRVQTSDCSNDVGASSMPSSTAPIYYSTNQGSSWTQL